MGKRPRPKPTPTPTPIPTPTPVSVTAVSLSVKLLCGKPVLSVGAAPAKTIAFKPASYSAIAGAATTPTLTTK